MVEFLNVVKVELVRSFNHSENNVYEFVANTFSYIPQLTDSDAGSFWNWDKTLVIDLPADEVLRLFSIERKAIVMIRTSDRRFYKIGTIEVPARVQISSNITSANLIIKCKMLTDPLL